MSVNSGNFQVVWGKLHTECEQIMMLFIQSIQQV